MAGGAGVGYSWGLNDRRAHPDPHGNELDENRGAGA